MRIRLIALALLLPLLTSCSTSLGYIPHYVTPGEMTGRTTPIRPSYPDVQELGYRQLHGYLVSARINKDAIYAGATTAAVAGAATIALAVFAPGSPALTAIPLAGGLLSAIATIAQNDPKALLYTRAALLTMTALLNSDRRMVLGVPPPSPEVEALCLRAELQEIDRRTGEHLLLLVPDNLAARFRAIGTNPEAAAALAKAANDFSDMEAAPAVCPPPPLPGQVVVTPPPR